MDIIAELALVAVVAGVGLTYNKLIDLTYAWGGHTKDERRASFYAQLTGVPDNHGAAK